MGIFWPLHKFADLEQGMTACDSQNCTSPGLAIGEGAPTENMAAVHRISPGGSVSGME